MDPPAVRKRRLAESVEILRRLLDGEEVTFAGEHYRLDGVRTMRATQARLPILVGVAGREALAHAARHADAIGLMGLGRTLADGQRHAVRWEPERLTATVDHIRADAGERFADDRAQRARAGGRGHRRPPRRGERLVAAIEGLTVEDALATPFLALGTHDEIAEHLLACRERWGISNYTVRSIEDMAPVIGTARCRCEDRHVIVGDVAPWTVTARNLAHHARNPIHTDAGAQAQGFPRALVAGVTTYAYLTHPVVAGVG